MVFMYFRIFCQKNQEVYCIIKRKRQAKRDGKIIIANDQSTTRCALDEVWHFSRLMFNHLYSPKFKTFYGIFLGDWAFWINVTILIAKVPDFNVSFHYLHLFSCENKIFFNQNKVCDAIITLLPCVQQSPTTFLGQDIGFVKYKCIYFGPTSTSDLACATW